MVVGTVQEIWRYPVKSMSGEQLSHCTVGPLGIPGDRGWALRDEGAGEVRGAKYLPRLMQCSARYRTPPGETDIPPVDIVLPDRTTIGSDDPDVNARLSALLRRTVTLWRLQPAANRGHYRRAQPGAFVLGWMSRRRRLRPYIGTAIRYAGLEAEVRAAFSREKNEALPDFSAFPPDLFEFTSPPGTYFDAFPIHLLTTASLEAMARVNPAVVWDVRRFRPNFLIATERGIEGLVEASWPPRTLRIGEAELKCEIPTVRCGMTTHAQDGLARDPAVLRTIVRKAGQNLGVYATPAENGCVAVGDRVVLE